jgi:hypothetical protein
MSDAQDKDIKSLVASLRQLANYQHSDVSIAAEAADLILTLYQSELISLRAKRIVFWVASLLAANLAVILTLCGYIILRWVFT